MRRSWKAIAVHVCLPVAVSVVPPGGCDVWKGKWNGERSLGEGYDDEEI